MISRALLPLALLSACAAPPAPPSPAPTAVHVEPPPPAPPADHGPLPARLVPRVALGPVLDLAFDPSGLRAAVWSPRRLAIWQREPGAASWAPLLVEPWGTLHATWQRHGLLLCGEGAAAQISEDTWSTAAPERCQRPASEPDDVSVAGRVRVTEAWTERACAERPRMSGDIEPSSRRCPADRRFTIDGPGAARVTLPVAPESVRALSPSGRWLLHHRRDGRLVLFDTSGRTSTPVGVAGPSGPEAVKRAAWLPDDGAVALVFADGRLVFVDPRTGAPTWELPVVPAASRLVVDAATGAPRVDHGHGPEESARRRRDAAVPSPVSPSERFVAAWRSRCDAPLVCGSRVEVAEVASGRVRHALRLPEATAPTVMRWLGPPECEVLLVAGREASYLRLSDGLVLHAEAPARREGDEPVLWSDRGHVDGDEAELELWAFRPSGRLDRGIDAKRLHRPQLWGAFLAGEPLPTPAPLAAGAAPP